MKQSFFNRTGEEEFWNVVTHGIGTIASIVMLFYMISLGKESTTNYASFAAAVFGMSLVTTYSASTFYHLYTFIHGNRSRKLRIWDHLTIYYLIAGSYTPFALLIMPPESGMFIFKLAWFMAILGTFYKIIFFGTSELLSIALYVCMGWLVLLDYQALVDHSSDYTLTCLKLGGAAYMIGTVFYANEKIPYNHVIWHLFVMAGSALHVAAVLDAF